MMDLLTDFKFWMFCWTILTCGVQWFINTKLTSHEVKSLKKDISALKQELDDFKHDYNEDKKDRTDLLIQMSKDISYIKGKTFSDDKIIKVFEKAINNK